MIYSTLFPIRSRYLVPSLLFAVGACGQAAVLISDSFTGLGTGDGALNGRTPETSLAGGNWVARTDNGVTGNGSGALSVSLNVQSTSYIDLGSFIGANQGVYEISITATHVAGSSLENWFAMGFTTGSTATSNFVGNNGQPWMLYRMNGNVNVYAGTGVSNPLASGITPGVHGAATGTAQTFTMVIDNSSGSVVLSAYANRGTAGEYVFDLSSGAGTSFTYGTAPALRYLGFGGSNNATTSESVIVDNFTVNFTPVPEPSALMLGAVSGLALFRRRRK